MVSKSIENTFCPIPWIHYSVNSLGGIRICCIGTHKNYSYLEENKTVLNAKTDLVPRNHELYKEVRSSMLNGLKHPLCRQCWSRERNGLDSNRETYKNIFYADVMEQAVKLTKEDGSINVEDFPIRYYDLRLGNKCNCRCIICTNTNSSMWEHNGKVTDWSGGNFETLYMKEMISNLNYIDRIYLTGGEPTIIKSHWELLELIIEKGYNKNINLDYNTNGVVLTKKMLDIWEKFKAVGIGFSIDGIGEVFEKIRYPTKWSTIEKNLKLFEEYAPSNIYSSFAMTICSENILNILDFFKWYSGKKFKKIRLFPHFNVLSRPPQLDINNIDMEQKLIIAKQYDGFYLWLKDNIPEGEYDKVHKNFAGIINSMLENNC